MRDKENNRFLSPKEACTILGVSIKALRLYERHGLITPMRSAAGWRAYGPNEPARLHQVLALKAFGLGLAQIAELLGGHSLSDVLQLQEQVLAKQSLRLDRARALVRQARNRLARGGMLSLEDLAQLTKETIMGGTPTEAELQALFEPHIAKHFSSAERASLAARPFDGAVVQAEWNTLIDEAKRLMKLGDPSSTEAANLARQWKAQIDRFTGGDPTAFQKAGAVWKDALADPVAAPQLPLDAEVFAFVGKAMAAAGV